MYIKFSCLLCKFPFPHNADFIIYFIPYYTSKILFCFQINKKGRNFLISILTEKTHTKCNSQNFFPNKIKFLFCLLFDDFLFYVSKKKLLIEQHNNKTFILLHPWQLLNKFFNHNRANRTKKVCPKRSKYKTQLIMKIEKYSYGFQFFHFFFSNFLFLLISLFYFF